MVTNDTDLMSSHHNRAAPEKPLNFARWFKHFMYMPWHTRKCFNAEVQAQISTAVAQAERDHAGEVQVIIEGHLPLNLALRANTRLRAQQLFAEYGVWDTAYNSGVLLYINLCERKVEIVADRGIAHFVPSEQWSSICKRITEALTQQQYADGVIVGIQHIGHVLDQYYDKKVKDLGNEIDNQAIFL